MTRSKIAIALILMFTMAVSMIAIPAVQAPSTAVVPTWLIASAEPSPVGVGQPVYINAFMTKPTSTSQYMGAGDRYVNLTVVIVTPTGAKTTYGPFRADSTGGIWFTYTPPTTGNYTVQAFYPGQVLTYGTTYNGMTYLPSESTIQSFAVQEEPIPTGYSSPPLPTEYWSRPIFATNYAWGKIGSNWFQPGSYDAAGKVDPYGTAPKSSHIAWTKAMQFGGQPGNIYADQGSVYYSQSLAAQYWQTPIILNGIMYYTTYTSLAAGTAGLTQTGTGDENWTAVDLRTGETLWTTKRGLTGTETLKAGQIWKWHSYQEFGACALLWSTAGSEFHLYDPLTGYWVANITGVNNAAFIQDFSDTTTEPGTVYQWYTTTNATGTYLNMWNSTRCIAYGGVPGIAYGGPGSSTTPATPGSGIWPIPPAEQNQYAWTVRPSMTPAYNYSSGIQWWKQINTTLNGNPVSLTSVSVTFSDLGANTKKILLLRSAGTIASQSSNGYQITEGFDAMTGALLWGPLNQTLPIYHDIGFIQAREGVYVLHDKDTNEAYGYSLTDGQKMWGPTKLPGNSWSNIARAGMIAYGNVYIHDYGGYVNAIDLQTGKINWTWNGGSAGYNTPYGIYPLWTQTPYAICDGMLFYSQGKMYDPPMSPGCQEVALNATDGTVVWSILAYDVKYPPAFADGYMVDWSSYDKQMYVFGKGQTATTVTASPKTSVHGSSVLVEGIVTDESPGTKNSDRVARFPQGVPAVSDESMSSWMEYVYMQQVKPSDATGVDVTVTVFDPNGNTYDVGTATSDANGFYSLMFTPEVSGKYTITATFEGSKSYWSSNAETAINVEETPAATPAPTPEPATFADMYFMPVSIGMIIAIVIVLALLLLLLFRKR
jgi:hypothetical protein